MYSISLSIYFKNHQKTLQLIQHNLNDKHFKQLDYSVIWNIINFFQYLLIHNLKNIRNILSHNSLLD